MTWLCAVLLLAPAGQPHAITAAATQQTAPVEATATNVASASQATLPTIPGGSRYSAPDSLPPVSAQLFRIGGRLEVEPLFSFSIGDPFWRTLGAGIRLEQHLDERWSLSAHVVGAASFLSAPVEVCGAAACSAPAAARLRSAPGKLQLLGGAELGWAPIYGKLSLFGGRTLHFDAYMSLGPEIVREMIAADAASFESGRWALGGRVALGERLFLTDRFTIRVAASELIYGSRVRGQSQVERKLSFEGGVAWLFGGR